MNSALWLPWWRALAGRRAWLAVPIGALLAAVLALDPVLGPEHGFGTYLAYASLFPIALLFRLGRAVDARRADGLEMEEDLRNPRGARAPLAALAAATLALALGLLMFALPPWLLAQRAPDSPPPAYHPVRTAAAGAGVWELDAGGAVPSATQLLLSFTWESLPIEGAALERPTGVSISLLPGEMTRVPLTPEEARTGRLQFALNARATEAGATLVRHLVRLEIPQPPLVSAPRVLARQFCFAWPLLPLVLLLARRGRAGGALSAVAALTLAGLLAFDPLDPPHLGSGPVEWIARGVLAVRDFLPDLRGVAAVGHGFELRSGTTSLTALLIWWSLGVLAMFACRLGRSATR